MKIVGNTVGMGLPKPNLKQTDPRKGDFVKGKDEIPTKASQIENDAGFLTEHQDISGKLDADKLPEAVNAALALAKESGEFKGDPGETPVAGVDYFTEEEKQAIAEQAAGLVVIPEVDLTGYATEEFVKNKIAEAELSGEDVDLSGYAQKSEIPTKVSQLANDTGYLTEHQDLSAYAKAKDIPKKPEDIGAQPAGNYALKSEVPSKTSELTNDSGFITGYTETDPTVPSWAKASTKPSYTKSEVGLGNVDNVKQYSANNPPPYPVTSVNGKSGAVNLDAAAVGARPATWTPSASEVGALPASTTIPSKTSQLTNDSGFITSYTETDPTVPSWAKAASKPSYTKSEVGLGNVDNVKQYSASNPPPYPVTSVNGKTGAVTVDVPTKVSQLTNDSGYLTKVTAANVQTALGYTPANDANTLRNAGWSANKNLGTDENGNVIEKDDIFSKDVSAWTPVEYMTGVVWTEKGYYWTVNGTHTSTQYTTDYQSTTELIRIEPNCSYTLSNFRGVAWLYDSQGKNGTATNQNDDPNNALTFETNANQYYIGISHKPVNAYTVDRVSLVRTTISEAEYNALPTRADSLKSLYGKTVVCFGDSLFGMYRGEDSAPAFVAKETGATVHNVGFGGCRMAVHPTSGYGAFSMWALAKAIAENNWTTQDAEASSGSAYFPEQLALLKSIDFSKVDIAVIHYGTNDFASGNGIPIDNASDHDDYNSLRGALRYSIEKLLSAYPKLRIYISLPVYRYWTDNGTTTYAETYLNKISKTLPEFVEALRNTAAEYNLPVIDGYYGLGINKANASTFLSDGTHHNATGRERFGRFIGQNLITQQTTGKSGMDTAAVQNMIDAAIAAIPVYNGEVV